MPLASLASSRTHQASNSLSSLEDMSDAELNNRLISILHELDTHSGLNHPSQQLGLTRDQGLGLSLFASCRSLLRAISFLLSEDHGEEATILMRTLLQDATTLFYIFKNQPTTIEMTLRFEYGSMKEERKLLVEALRHSPDEDTEEGIAVLDGQIEDTKDEATQIKLELQPLPHMQQMLDELGLSEGYFFFRYASHAVHTSRLALAARMKDGEEGQVVVDFGGTPRIDLDRGALLRRTLR